MVKRKKGDVVPAAVERIPTVTIGPFRLPEEVAHALDRVAGMGRKTAYIESLLRRDLERRGELAKTPRTRSLFDE